MKPTTERDIRGILNGRDPGSYLRGRGAYDLSKEMNKSFTVSMSENGTQ